MFAGSDEITLGGPYQVLKLRKRKDKKDTPHPIDAVWNLL